MQSSLAQEDVKKLLKQSDQVVDYERSVLKNGRAYQLYPYVDPREWTDPPSSSEFDKFKEKVGLKADEKLVVIVARMDRIKSQDIGIRAFKVD